MKKFLALAFLCVASTASASSVVANGTRFIYPSTDKEITVQLKNTGDKPALVQTWLDEGDPSVSPDNIRVPFSITPPIGRIDGNSGQTLRIRALSRTGIPTDRESIWYLNMLEIPSKLKNDNTSDENSLQLAIRSRFKFFYRPVSLGSTVGAAKKLVVASTGKDVTVQNPTPFYMTISYMVDSHGNPITKESKMIPPKTTETYPLTARVNKGETITISTVNDFGSAENTITTVK